ncbi:UPF0746 protein DDB_G0281095 [Drosophila eugracilis]|uniref:UPF0746 protein DDB_G0281095 n=1 Tax=Drosophila eugracilis TaxID=29029 RepID=UPI0007E806AE|nr:UPF0746 protein DDB_G0281095 [Drosophila eugracilis]
MMCGKGFGMILVLFWATALSSDLSLVSGQTVSPLTSSTSAPPKMEVKPTKPMIVNAPPKKMHEKMPEAKVNGSKPLQVTGFITKSGNIYEIEDKRGSIGSIEGRQADQIVCNYGNVVIYSDVPCDQVKNVRVGEVKPLKEDPVEVTTEKNTAAAEGEQQDQEQDQQQQDLAENQDQEQDQSEQPNHPRGQAQNNRRRRRRPQQQQQRLQQQQRRRRRQQQQKLQQRRRNGNGSNSLRRRRNRNNINNGNRNRQQQRRRSPNNNRRRLSNNGNQQHRRQQQQQQRRRRPSNNINRQQQQRRRLREGNN